MLKRTCISWLFDRSSFFFFIIFLKKIFLHDMVYYRTWTDCAERFWHKILLFISIKILYGLLSRTRFYYPKSLELTAVPNQWNLWSAFTSYMYILYQSQRRKSAQSEKSWINHPSWKRWWKYMLFSYTFIKYSGNVNSMYNHNIYKISLVIKFSAHFQYTDFHEFQHVNVLFNT